MIIISIGIFLLINNNEIPQSLSQSSTPAIELPKKELLQQPETVIIDVKGEILKPGVYEITSGSRVNDIIQLAGGFTKSADQTKVNLAQKVQDEMIIVIPKIGQTVDVNTPASNENGKLRINYATQEEIETLSGIGPSKAQAIIKFREENGFFKTLDDLLEVSGIGDKTIENLKESIQIP